MINGLPERIYFSVLGKDEDYKKTRDALDSALGFIRRLIARRIKLRFTPEICFREDKSCEQGIRIQEMLDKLNESKKPVSLPKKRVRIKAGKEGHGEPKKSSRVRKKA